MKYPNLEDFLLLSLNDYLVEFSLRGCLYGISKSMIPLFSLLLSKYENCRVVLYYGKKIDKGFLFNKGSNFDINVLSELGFQKVGRVWNTGEYSVLGDVVIFWERGNLYPLRISLFDSSIESLAYIDSESRLSIRKLESYYITNQNYEGYTYSSDFGMSEGTKFFKFSDKGGYKNVLPLRELPNLFNMNGSEFSKKSLEGYVKQGFKIYAAIGDTGEIDCSISEASYLLDKHLVLSNSLINVNAKYLILNENDIKGEVKLDEGLGGRDIFKSISINDYVVHKDHGIGVFKGVCIQNSKTYLEIVYAGNDKLLIPIDQYGLISKYVGAGKKIPVLSGLNSGAWKRVKDKAKKEITKIARELLVIYAMRKESRCERFLFPEDIKTISEFARTFKYEDTEDQSIITQEIIKDLMGEIPMDRLLVGDVGFGKTEIAIRTAFAALIGGKQVAVLAPTTVLVSQHLSVFRERLARYGFRVESISRLTEKVARDRIIEGLRSGVVDLVIGTHFLLNKSLEFKDLGLLIVDEEQRFGVLQKDRLKEKRLDMHVLSMSATPIPRTLNMALLGIRDMSILGSVPIGRKPVKNWIGKYSDEIVTIAIKRELVRGGQIYYVHNRVKDILSVKRKLELLVPDIKVGVAHGALRSSELAKVMNSFINREFDLLLSTTIIENGLDLLNVNTLIVDEAERFGLSQLYQIRGRVGRSEKQAYAYFAYRCKAGDSEIRFDALKESESLGSGYIVSSRDLEIRGAGNILGRDQSGTISSVGYSMYIEYLNEALKTIKAGLFSRADSI